MIERAEEVKGVVDEKSCQEIQAEVEEVTSKWNDVLHDLETRKDTLNQLAIDWNVSKLIFNYKFNISDFFILYYISSIAF